MWTSALALVVSGGLLTCAAGVSQRGVDTEVFAFDAEFEEHAFSNDPNLVVHQDGTRRGLVGGARMRTTRDGWLHHQAASPNLVQELNKHRRGPNPHSEGVWLLLFLLSTGMLSWIGNRYGICCTTRGNGQRPIVRGP